MLAEYITEQPEPNESIIEIGGGVSTWYLHQLNFEDYVMLETYAPAFDIVVEKIPSVKAIKKWEEIPKKKYQYIFIDSHVGGPPEVQGHQREEPLKYIMENGLFSQDSVLIVHDYNKIKRYRGKSGTAEANRYKGWNRTVDEYGWEIVHEVIYRRCFGVYKLKQEEGK
jgi:hypothetical protein